MARIAGVEIPTEKRLDIALTYVYGIGRSNVVGLLHSANLETNRRVKTLTDEEISRINKALEKYVVEGDLRRQVSDSVKRLIEIKSYRGARHVRKLPVRGQRTRTNARTKRGKRVTVGALKKEDRVKLGSKAPEEEKK